MSEIKSFLKQIEMFIGLSDHELDRVAEFCRAKTFTPNSTIIERNSPADSFYLVEDGTVEIITAPDRRAEGMGEGLVVTLGKGQSFGEMGLVDSGARSATVKAVTETRLYEIDCSRFRELCERDTNLGYQVMKNIAVDLSFKLRSRNLI